MSEVIVYIDSSEIREGKLEQLKAAIDELSKFVEANEPRLLAYRVYLSEDGDRMSVLHVHPDAASLEFHMAVAGPSFRGFIDLVELSRIDVYGKVDEELVEQLRLKARVLGMGTVAIHELHAGFARFQGT